jgi:PKD repeat protein
VVQGCDAENDKFYTYSVGPQGLDVNNPIISAVGFTHGSPLGEMEFSPDGTKLAYNAWLDYFVALFDFNSSTGVFSNPRRKFYDQGLGTPYGVEFSPNGQYLFVAANYFNNAIYRLTLPDLSNELQFANTSSQGYDYGLLSTGPDGKIYMGRRDKDYISCLSTPNDADPGFVNQAISLSSGNISTIGLPLTFRVLSKLNRSISVTRTGGCQLPISVKFQVNDTTQIVNPIWNFGNGTTSAQFNPTYQYPAFGNYQVTFSYTDPKTGCTSTRTDSVKLQAGLSPTILSTETRDSCSKKSTFRLMVDSSLFVSFNWQNSLGQSSDRSEFSFEANSGTIQISGEWLDTANCPSAWNSSIISLPYPDLPKLKIVNDKQNSTCDSNTIVHLTIEDSLRFQNILWRIGTTEYSGHSFHQSLPAKQPTKIYLTALSRQGKCPLKDSLTITPSPFQFDSLAYKIGFKLQSCSQLNTVISFRPVSQYSYSWDFGAGYLIVKTVSDTMIVLPFANPGKQTIQLTAQWNNSCEFSQKLNVEIPKAVIPNLITANGDDINDAFILPFPEEIKRIEIYNRWGGPVFENLGYKNDWKPADDLEAGSYFFRLLYVSGQGCSGWLQVLR